MSKKVNKVLKNDLSDVNLSSRTIYEELFFPPYHDDINGIDHIAKQEFIKDRAACLGLGITITTNTKGVCTITSGDFIFELKLNKALKIFDKARYAFKTLDALMKYRRVV